MKKVLPKAIPVEPAAIDLPIEIALPEPSFGRAPHPIPSAVGALNCQPTVEPESSNRHTAAVKLIERFALWAGAAGVIPVPFLDLAGVGAVQIQLVRRLAAMFDVEFSRSRGKALVAALGSIFLTGSSGLGAATLTKAVPVIGPAVSSIAIPGLAAGMTYAVGIAFLEHFEKGGTLLDFKPSPKRLLAA